MAPLLDQLLLPQRVVARIVDDLRRIADAAVPLGALATDLRSRSEPIKRSANDAAATFRSLRDEVSGIREAVQPMSPELDALRVAFGGTRDELERLRGELIPELGGLQVAADRVHGEVQRQRELIDALTAQVKEMGERLAAGIQALNATIESLARDAGEVREVVEPLQAASERVGRVAERLPGPGRKK